MARISLDTRRSDLFFSIDFIVVDDAARMCTDIPSTEVSAGLTLHGTGIFCPSLWLRYECWCCRCIVTVIIRIALFLAIYSMPLSCRFLYRLSLRDDIRQSSTCSCATACCQGTGAPRRPPCCARTPPAGTRWRRRCAARWRPARGTVLCAPNVFVMPMRSFVCIAAIAVLRMRS
jgi:hypothetical protein